MKHVVLRNPLLTGWEYGMLRAFEQAIVKGTGATVVDLPVYSRRKSFSGLQHGMRLGRLRKWLPKKKLTLEADVLWCILMGPENLGLDLFTGWKHIKHRIVYIFDTLPPQYLLMRKLFSSDDFNIKITSFNDAQKDLESLTGKKWLVMEQAATDKLFHTVPLEEKCIHFSSYGRRLPVIHEILIDFCRDKGLYYDYTSHDGRHPTTGSEELYKQYAWHLNHSLFTISWPVELTNPLRAGQLHPITCRWFEAACSGTTILGRKPANEAFNSCLFSDLVIELDPQATKDDLYKKLESIWEKRDKLYDATKAMQEQYYRRMIWENRVSRILEWIS